MATTNTAVVAAAGAVVPATQNTNSDNLTQEKVTYKGFALYDEKGAIKDFNAKQESAKNKAWEQLEKNGYTLFNEVEFVKYTVHSMDGFAELVPDEDQRVYIIQSGLNYVQNSKANGVMQERLEDNELSPKHNNTTIDLRPYINMEPQKRVLTDQQKIERLLSTITGSKEEKSAILQALMAKFAAVEEEPEAEAELQA